MRRALLLLALAACNKPREAPRADAAPAPAARRGIDPRDAKALAAELLAAERLPPDQQDARFEAIVRDWAGRRYRWTGHLVPTLCRTASACHAVVLTPEAKQGWLPRFALDPAAHARLLAGCPADGCEVTIEGTLELSASSAEATKVILVDAVASRR